MSFGRSIGTNASVTANSQSLNRSGWDGNRGPNIKAAGDFGNGKPTPESGASSNQSSATATRFPSLQQRK
jgi:hypothetical protein